MFFTKKKLEEKKRGRHAEGLLLLLLLQRPLRFFFFLVSFGRGFDALPNGCLQVSALMLVFSLSSGDAFQEKVADVTASRYLFV